VHKSAQQYRRNLVASAGDSFLPTIAALNAEELQQLLQQHNDTTSNMQDKTQHGQPLQLRPLRSPKEVLAGRGRNSGSGSGKKGGSGSGRKTKAKAKTTPGDDEGDGGSGAGEGASGDDATAHKTVVLRGEVPAANIYYFAKGNVKEGWLVKQGAPSLLSPTQTATFSFAVSDLVLWLAACVGVQVDECRPGRSGTINFDRAHAHAHHRTRIFARARHAHA
jgi:hypothetical protein